VQEFFFCPKLRCGGHPFSDLNSLTQGKGNRDQQHTHTHFKMASASTSTSSIDTGKEHTYEVWIKGGTEFTFPTKRLLLAWIVVHFEGKGRSDSFIASVFEDVERVCRLAHKMEYPDGYYGVAAFSRKRVMHDGVEKIAIDKVWYAFDLKIIE
jgi:hypothetical protein